MNYKLFFAALAAILICVANSCNDADDQSPEADSQGLSSKSNAGAANRSTSEIDGMPTAMGGSLGQKDTTASDGVGAKPIVHLSALQAWLLVETSYIVIEQMWQESEDMILSDDLALVEQGKQLRKEIGTEIDSVVFDVNETVDNLFKDAIAQEPENPNNLATYAFYLKPRRRRNDDSFVTTDVEAFKLLDQAIELDPDNAIWYLLKINAKTAPHVCGSWFREYAEEELAIQRWIPEVRQLFDQAEAAAPDNGYINYYNAILLSKFAGPSHGFPERDEILREIRAGNRKETVNFFFPPPIPAFAEEYWRPVLRPDNHAPVFFDHWSQFSTHSMQDVDILLSRVGSTMSWSEDKADIGELMLMLYQMGRTQPYDRSFFGLQLKLLHPIAERIESGSDDALEMAEIIRYLNDQYQTVANELYDDDKITDPAKVGVIGLHEVERGYSHRIRLARLIQVHHMAFLKRTGEITGLEFELFEQPRIE